MREKTRTVEGAKPRRQRADSKQSADALLRAAAEVFAKSGVDAPVREIADQAGVGLGTLYRHFPQRSDLIAAVMQSQVDACAEAVGVFASQFGPAEALIHWFHRFMDFLALKRGLASALHSGDPAYNALPHYFLGRVGGALQGLLDEAVNAEAIRPGIDAEELLWTVATICQGRQGEVPAYAQKMVDILIDGLRCLRTN